MSQRLDATKWLWCILTMLAGPPWSSVDSVTVQTPPKNPSVIEAQAKFFQDFFSVQLSPYKIEFGHVCEDPNTWEQRYEKKDFKNHRDMGKVRWGDKQGGYGEHYWDLNHAGHGNDRSDEYDGNSDDGSYNHDLDHAHEDHDSHDSHDAYDEPSEHLPSYGTEEYDSEKAAKYDDENGRAKRAQPRIKTERKLIRQEETYQEEPQKVKLDKHNRKTEERLQAAPTHQVEKVSNEKLSQDSDPKPPKRKRQQRRQQHVQENVNNSDQQKTQENQPHEELNNQEQQQQEQPQQQQAQPQQQQAQTQQQQQQFNNERQPDKQFVPYEQGAGVRYYQQPQLRAASSVPRLFLEPTTGHVVDRATGQAYVLQPIAMNNYN